MTNRAEHKWSELTVDGLTDVLVTPEQVHAAQLTIAEYSDQAGLPREETQRLLAMLTGDLKPVRNRHGSEFMSRTVKPLP